MLGPEGGLWASALAKCFCELSEVSKIFLFYQNMPSLFFYPNTAIAATKYLILLSQLV